ncbi:lanthionine synthetase LanC family protein [Georgenia sp. AZ-5]|uniref:lanthionine synthetase LanC family protein n=1 Tax=Georgenia sp. AZ-5 TaxID=3367526 RepID=UPI00375490AE
MPSSVLLPFERPAGRDGSALRAATAARVAEGRTGELIDLGARRGSRFAVLDDASYPQVREHLVRSILAAATPQRADRLFPGDPQQLLRPHGGVSLGSGAAGVLWTLAELGAEVPTELVDWLEGAVDGMEGPGPGLVDGLGGIALALDRLGRREAAERAWAEVEQAPLEDLGVAMADGLAGVGLALLERAPLLDGEGTLRLLARIAHLVVDKLEQPGGRLYRPGLLHGGAGVALFLLHAYELTAEQVLLDHAERALRRDLAHLGWPAFSAEGAPELWRSRPLLGSGSAGVVMVLHEAMTYLDAPWVFQARESLAAACEEHVGAHAGLFHGWAGTLAAVQYVRARPWDPAADPRAAVRPHLERLGHPSAQARIPYVGLEAARSSADLGTGAAGVLLALDYLLGAEPRRLPFFW